MSNAPSLRRILGVLAGVLVSLTALAACGSADADENGPLRILASSTPHAEILKQVQDSGLLEDVELEISEISGDIDANQLLEAGDIDANFFQHDPYLQDWLAEHNTDDLVNVAAVHVEPLGIYSENVTSLDDVPNGATVALSNNLPNFARGLFLLQDAGLITLDVQPTDEGLDFSQVTEANITENPKQLSFVQIDPAQLPNTLQDGQIDVSVINGNYALEAGLSPADDALELEPAEDNPYANTLTVKKELQDDPRVQALAEALESPEIAKWIDEQYAGSVIPVHGK